MNANVQHPLAQLQAAEAKLIGTLTAATARINGIAGGEVDTALETFHAACLAASTRLAGIGVAVRALAGEVLFELDNVSGEIDAALAGVEMPRNPLEDIESIAPPTAEENVSFHDSVVETRKEGRPSTCGADVIFRHSVAENQGRGRPSTCAVPYAPLNEPGIDEQSEVGIPTSLPAEPQPAFDVGHHNQFSKMTHEKYPAVPEDQPDDSPSLFAEVAACSPVSRDDRPRDLTAKQPRRRKGR